MSAMIDRSSVISLKNVSFSRKDILDTPILDKLDFSISVGQKIGIMGPNGSGKTTFFHIIMGLIKPDDGDVEIFGKPAKSNEDFVEVRKKVGLLFQDSDDQLFCPTVEEDIAFGPLNQGKTHEEARAIVDDTCRKLGLTGFQKRVNHKLSGGQKRLCAFATIVAMSPLVYLLDEPTSGLDIDAIDGLIYFLDIHSKTHIIISHDLEFLKSTTDTILILKDGRFEQSV